MPDPTRHALPVVKVNFRVVAPHTLISMRVQQSIHGPDQFRLRFHDRGLTMVDQDLFPMGAPVDLAVDVGGGPTNLLRGEITQVSVELSESGRTELVVSGLDRGHKLARGVKVHTFVQMTDGHVVQYIAAAHGLQAKVGPTTLIHDYLFQYGTDFAFLNERARALGYEWWVSDRTLHFQPRPHGAAGPELAYGRNLRSLRLRVSAAETSQDVTVQSWDPVVQRPVTAMAAAANGLPTDAPFAKTMVNGAKKIAKTKRFTGSTPVANAAEAKALAGALADRASAEQVIAKGEALGDPRLVAGGHATVTEAGQRISGSYFLTEVEHVIDDVIGYVTRFTSGGHDSGDLVSLLRGNGAHRAWVDALLVGVVTNNDDPEGLGRVKVWFPSLSDTNESAWARVVSVGAGSTRGLQMVPEVNDEVLVGFEQGDPRRPLVLGGLWSGINAHPDPTGHKKQGAVWRSHVGHTIEMSDGMAPNEKFINLALGDKRTAMHIGEDEVSMKTPRKLAMESQMGGEWKVRGQLLIEADQITIRARAGIVIDGGVSVEMKANTMARVAAGFVDVKGQNTTLVHSGGLTEVKGSVVRIN